MVERILEFLFVWSSGEENKLRIMSKTWSVINNSCAVVFFLLRFFNGRRVVIKLSIC